MIARYVTVVCDCDDGYVDRHWRICHGETDPEHTVKQARAEARRRGYVHRGGRDLCPPCAAGHPR